MYSTTAQSAPPTEAHYTLAAAWWSGRQLAGNWELRRDAIKKGSGQSQLPRGRGPPAEVPPSVQNQMAKFDHLPVIWPHVKLQNVFQNLTLNIISNNICKIKSFGDIPNSSSIDILMPYAISDYIGAFLRNGFAHVDNVIPVIKKQLHGYLQGNKPHRNSPEPSEPCLRNLHQHVLALFGTLRNRPNPAFGTYTNTCRNSPEPSGTFQDLPESTFRNLPKPTSGTYASIPWNPPKSSGTFREFASGSYTILHRDSPEPSVTCLQNLHHFTPQLSGTFRNPPPEPTPAHTGTFRNPPPEPTPAHAGTLRNLPEPSSGTCSCDPHRHTPELIWAEDPISLRCWGKIRLQVLNII